VQTRFSQACHFVAAIAFNHRCANRVRLHHLAYYSVRERFGEIGFHSSSVRSSEHIWNAARFAKRNLCDGKAAGICMSCWLCRIYHRVRAPSTQRLSVGKTIADENLWPRSATRPARQSSHKCKNRFARHRMRLRNHCRKTSPTYGSVLKPEKRIRTRLHRWAWRQLQEFIEYKATSVGIAVHYVDPAYTSKTCASCDRPGMRRRHRFSCTKCGVFAHSDRNAARNLAKIGVRALAPTGDVMRTDVAV
jgi:hypothetical protein